MQDKQALLGVVVFFAWLKVSEDIQATGVISVHFLKG